MNLKCCCKENECSLSIDVDEDACGDIGEPLIAIRILGFTEGMHEMPTVWVDTQGLFELVNALTVLAKKQRHNLGE